MSVSILVTIGALCVVGLTVLTVRAIYAAGVKRGHQDVFDASEGKAAPLRAETTARSIRWQGYFQRDDEGPHLKPAPMSSPDAWLWEGYRRTCRVSAKKPRYPIDWPADVLHAARSAIVDIQAEASGEEFFDLKEPRIEIYDSTPPPPPPPPPEVDE